VNAPRILLVAVSLVGAVACTGAPPQIVDYAPERGATNVSTAAPIQITFDHDVDQASVEQRLHLVPSAPGTVRWVSGRKLLYEHQTLQPSTTYEVVLEAGYTDTAGNAYSLRHHWSFVTEPPPSLAAASPGGAETGVDLAAYLILDFSRAMNAASLKGALTFSPSVAFSVRLDPSDARRVIIAPNSLLEPSTTYKLAVDTGALDVDGNKLDRDRAVVFTTGPVQPLRHWIAFVTDSAAGSPTGLWIVNESGFPRLLLDSRSVHSYSWSPEGDRLLVQGDDLTWLAYTPGGGLASLDFKASWAQALASGLGYAYIDSAGSLHRELADASDYVISTEVSDAAVNATGDRVAFVQVVDGASTLWGYDVGLRSRYVLGTDTGIVSSLQWSPADNRIAYIRNDVAKTSIRVRNLGGAGGTTTIASGDVGAPVWLRDSVHLLFSATVATATLPIRKAFLVNVVTPPVTLTSAIALPSDPAIDVSDPFPSPDGHQIAFITKDQVWLMNADGTRPAPLTRFDPDSFPYSCRAPAWTRS
jgi:dipeptidyl aminopeptidase/acylaminoacyl peptidase